MAYEVTPSYQSVVEKELAVREMGEAEYESLPTNSLGSHMLAGGAAGILEHTVMYPVDCVKTRMMTLQPDPKARYRSVLDALVRIAKTEQPRSLFRGMSLVATAAGPAHALYFSMYESMKTAIPSKNPVVAQGIAGACASVVHDGFMNPVEAVKQRMQVYNSPYRGNLHCALSVYRKEGLRAFYRSYGTQLTMNIPFQVVHFITYEHLQDHLNSDRHYNPTSHVLSGAGAGGFAALITTPLDVAKTLLNTKEQERTLSRERRVKGVIGALRTIYTKAGVRGYFNGASARVLFQMPSAAICWSVYELFKHLLGLKRLPDSTNTAQ